MTQHSVRALGLSRSLPAALLATAALAAQADPLTYLINFTGGDPTPAVGLFTYDASTSTFSNFEVAWHNAVFDLTASANAPMVGGACPGVSSSGATGFALMTKSLCAGLYDRWFGNANLGYSSFTFSSQTLSLPEKNAAGVTALGAGDPNAFPATFAGGDWSLSAPFSVPAGAPSVQPDGTVFFPGGQIYLPGLGLRQESRSSLPSTMTTPPRPSATSWFRGKAPCST